MILDGRVARKIAPAKRLRNQDQERRVKARGQVDLANSARLGGPASPPVKRGDLLLPGHIQFGTDFLINLSGLFLGLR